MAILNMLQAMPEVQRVNHLRYWGEEIFFVVIQPITEETVQKTEAALRRLLQGQENGGRHHVRLRFFAPGQLLPSSATLYRRQGLAAAPSSA